MVLIENEVRLTTEVVWTMWNRENLASAGIRTPVVQPLDPYYTD
jgi:hypothetical protein